MGTYVTETGFNKRTYEELVTYYTSIFKSVFGDDVDLDPVQATGALLDYLASTDAQTWDALQDTYTANDLRNAVGVSLDNNIGALINVLRQDATKAQVHNVVLFGYEGVTVPAGKRARNTTTIDADRVTFELDADTLITQFNAREAWFSVDYDIANTYIITLNSEAKYIGSQASAEAVVDAYVTLLEAEGPQVYNAEKVLVDGTYQLRVWYDATINNPLETAFDVGAAINNMVLEEFGSPGNFTALLEGYVGVGVGFISEIATGVSGWLRVYNTDPKVLNTGTGVELDPEYRLNLQLGVSASGFATEDAIRRVVLNDVAAVSACIVKSNRTITAFPPGAPTNGQQPKSFQTYVDGIGPLIGPPTTEQQELAEAIFKAAGHGIEIFGTEGPIEVQDDDGETQEVYYSEIVGTEIEAHVSRGKYEEFNPYPLDGDDQIKTAMAAYATANWFLDKDVIPSRLITPVYISVPGIGEMYIECRIKGVGSYSTDPIPITGTAVATLDASDISIQDIL